MFLRTGYWADKAHLCHWGLSIVDFMFAAKNASGYFGPVAFFAAVLFFMLKLETGEELTGIYAHSARRSG